MFQTIAARIPFRTASAVSLRIFLLPVPTVPAHSADIPFRFPAKLCLCLICIGIILGRVACPPRCDRIIDLQSVCLLERMHDFQYALRLSRSQIIDRQARRVKLCDSLPMPCRKIHHMDVIADASAIRRVIIVAKYVKSFPFTYRHLRDIRHKIVRFSIWIFPNPSALMRANRIEIPQHNDGPAFICMVKVCEAFVRSPAWSAHRDWWNFQAATAL